MDQLIGLAIFLATTFGGGWLAHDIYVQVRTAALTKAAQGLPSLSEFSRQLTIRQTDTKLQERRAEAIP